LALSVVPIPNRKISAAGFDSLPALILRAGDQAMWRFAEFFAANIRNKNTRAAYAHAVTQFFHWCESRHLALTDLRPAVVAAYIEQHPSSAPTVKQHLAAVRMLFDWLVIGQIVPMNPASSVRGPKHVVKVGKTPVLKADQARQLLDCNRQANPGKVSAGIPTSMPELVWRPRTVSVGSCLAAHS
jgi:site-specific recombinase XerD